MIVLVANLGSTSFKYKLFDMSAGEAVIAQGAADRIGRSASDWTFTAENKASLSGSTVLANHAEAIDLHLKLLFDNAVIKSLQDVEAIGFKAVHGGPLDVVRVDGHVLNVMEQFSDVAPAHNPPYIAAMRAFAKRMPAVPQVAAFETAFHRTIPLQRQAYAIPHEWTEKLEIRRYGFHGASHRYIATRMAEIIPNVRKIISCHLGGSCSVCAIADGKSVANSFGMTAQTGIPHATRTGDFDAFAILKLLQNGLSLETVWKVLGSQSGLLGASGVSSDCREVEKAAAAGNARARLALEIFVEAVRHYIGAYLVILNGADAIVLTGGIGQHGADIRKEILSGMEFAGIILDENGNRKARGEARMDAAGSRVQLWVLPTNEELIVARQTVSVLQNAA